MAKKEIDERQPSPVEEIKAPDFQDPDTSSLENDTPDEWLDGELYARHVEIKNAEDLEKQRGTPIPALFNQFYKFVQNPSSVSVETFKRMVDTDDTIGSGVDFLVTCLCARMGQYQHPSAEITEFINKVFQKVQGGITNVFKEILSAPWIGFSVSEKVWWNDPELGFIPKKIVTLPPSTVLFETDRTGEITYDGILQYQRNYNPMVLSQGVGFLGGAVGTGFGFADSIRPDLFAKMGDLPFPLRTANTYNYLSIRIPRQKCIHYAFDAQGKFGNPYGRSLLRRAYKYYVIKDEILRMLAIALDRKGTPLTVIFADPNATIQDAGKAGNLNNQKGKVVGTRADKAAAEAFSKIHNDTVAVLPGKRGQIYDIENLTQQSNAQDFISALNFCNMSILRSLLIPSLIFGNGDGTGSYSLGQEHAKTFDKILDGWLAGFINVIQQQLVFDTLAFNYPRSAWEKDGLGDFSKRELTQDERNKEAEVIEKGVNMGAISHEDLQDLNTTREKLGYAPKDKPFPKEDLLDGDEFGESDSGEENGGSDDRRPQGGKRDGRDKPRGRGTKSNGDDRD